jgi:hypothetical protein
VICVAMEQSMRTLWPLRGARDNRA